MDGESTDKHGEQTEHDAVLEAIEDGDVHDQLLGYMDDEEAAEEALARLLGALPSFIDRECQDCGRDLTPLDDSDWIAWRLRVEDTDFRRTDLYCGLGCLASSINAEIDVPLTEGFEE